MSNLVVDDQQGLKEVEGAAELPPPMLLKIPATIISVIFHPLFVPVYVVALMVYIFPYLYSGFGAWDKKIIVIQAFVMYTLFPLVTVGLLKALKFISSAMLKTQRDRIIPYVVCNVWYFWAWYVRHNLPGTAPQLVYFSLAIFLCSSLGLIANIYMKVSMHAMAMGLASMFMILMGISQDISFTAFVSLSMLTTGLVCTARLLIGAHRPNEIYSGLLIGALSQLVAYFLA